MTEAALLLALLFARPPGLVETVYATGGLDAVALVWCESQFVTTALRREPRGHTSWGLGQLDDEWHPQYRDDLLLHCVTFVSFLDRCKAEAGRLRYAVELYNGAAAWGLTVERTRDSLALYLWRHLR